MWYQISQYIKFIFKSTNQHGVHSPFVYDLITKCFYNKTSFEAYKNISEYRKDLINNHSKIEVTDLGAGSNKIKTNTRTISEMAKHAGTTQVRAKLLFRLVNYFKFNTILELGTSLGIATHAMQLANPKARVITIEGCRNLSELAKTQLLKHRLLNIQVIHNDFEKALKGLNNQTFDLVFFDGNHHKKATLMYFETLLQGIHNDSVFIFDDIYWSKSMTEAWETIKQHPRVTMTIDTFFWGMVFFRREQHKQHFTIRV
ncbi:MAG: class I SAM-dependent methyltransferase [Flavobacteriales bacterium]|nr:class I SAM-dependent methyltransferase [Flavobacteriia bacterium]NCP05116.1 class I SAM-dependent methyltransferase [Flavobacteriales bacterium]PIV93365.1 MAG: methyltransferase [Flavobacteriaceae bacterium CG17_big_fil_post_rev_8_21_14_2_50_33_15]PIY09778.1 MAG: methyltransferase [Flavobacteriaceae bacterium CG_4_10_14_3_um_filter_33_47]PJB17556.1 MAG: methyltransferase [Flavobacteriaceae bacterium CG_4_9_14_3_um_filter_33_16]